MNAPALIYKTDLGTGDIQLGLSGPASAPWLVTAVFMLLFTNCSAPPDQIPTNMTAERGGYWGDMFFEQSTGSLLWLLERAQATQQTLNAAITYCQSALQPLIDESKLTAVTVQGDLQGTMIALDLVYTLPSGEQGRLDLREIWDYAVAA